MPTTDDDDDRCTCPPDPPHAGPGVPILMPGKSHRRGCPVVQWIFDSGDEIARKMAADHVQRGGVIPSPGEQDARENRRRIEALERRVRELEAP